MSKDEPFELNPITPEMRELHQQYLEVVYWTDKRLKKITRIRFLSDPGFPFMDLSYCYGELHDGSPVRVDLPFFQLNKKTWKTDIIKHAQKDGVFAKGLGIFEAFSYLV